MGPDRLQLQRLELKYHVNERTALRVRDFVQSYLVLDEYGEGQPDYSYPIHSIYLDADDLRIYWDTIGGNKNRYKLRVRYYDDNPESPVFFEIKRRSNDAILKQRGAVHRKAADLILAGHWPEREHLLSTDPRQLVAVQRFSQLMQANHAVPKAHIYYRREAWISATDNSVRVTMDRDIKGSPEVTTRFHTNIRNYVMPFKNIIILELKYTGRFPTWFGDLVQAFNLHQCAAAKFAESVILKGEHCFYGNTWRDVMLSQHGELAEFPGRHLIPHSDSAVTAKSLQEVS